MVKGCVFRFKKRSMMNKVLNILLPTNENEWNNELKKTEKKIENKLKEKYERLYQNKSNNYFLELVEIFSIRSILFEFKNYHDQYPALYFRKLCLLFFRLNFYQYRIKIIYKIIMKNYVMYTTINLKKKEGFN